jgi:hypothetical protein
MIKFGDLYVFYSELDFSIWRVSEVIKNPNEKFSRVTVKKLYLVDDDDFNSNMEFGVYPGDDIKQLEKANNCRNKFGVITRLFK